MEINKFYYQFYDLQIRAFCEENKIWWWLENCYSYLKYLYVFININNDFIVVGFFDEECGSKKPVHRAYIPNNEENYIKLMQKISKFKGKR